MGNAEGLLKTLETDKLSSLFRDLPRAESADDSKELNFPTGCTISRGRIDSALKTTSTRMTMKIQNGCLILMSGLYGHDNVNP